MALYQVSQFWYDEATGNIFINLHKEVDVSYDTEVDYGGSGTDVYEAQIYLDGGIELIGKIRPPSLDGSVEGGVYGRNGTGAPEGKPLNEAPN